MFLLSSMYVLGIHVAMKSWVSDLGGPALVVPCVLKLLLYLWTIGEFSYLWEHHTRGET